MLCFLSKKRKSLAAISCLPVEGGGGIVQCLLLYTRYCLVLFVSRKRCLSICKRRMSLARCVFEALLRSALFTFKKEICEFIKQVLRKMQKLTVT